MKQSYEEYRFSMTEILKYLVQGLLLCGAVDYLFYQNPWLMFLALPVTVFFLKWKKKGLIRERKKNLNYQFKDALNALSVAVQAGYSVENAVRETGRDLRMIYEENADMVQELAAMQRRMDSNQTLEEAMRDFAERSGIPEAETFAEIFTMGKRSGGDLIEIMEDTARTIAQTVETERAIAATLASRRYEQKIMNGIPFVIVLYLRIGCPGFMDPVYGNIVGVCVMTGCLLLYLGAWYLGRRMLEIEV